jgi:integrase
MAPPRIPKTLRVHGLDFAIWQLSDGRFAFDYKDAEGERQVVRRTDFEKLRRKAGDIALGIRNAETKAADLTADDRRDAALAIEIRGDAAVSLAEAMRFFVKNHAALQPAPGTPQILAELIADLRTAGREADYVAGLKRDLTPFAAAFPDLAACGSREIEQWLAGLGKAARRRDNVRDAIVTLFRYARKREWLQDRRTAAEAVERIAEGGDVATWTPREMKLLLEHVSDRWLPFVALGAFAGMRTSEIFRLEWSAIRWERKVIAVHRRVARKVRIARLMPMSENLLAWLSPWREAVGALYPNKRTHGVGTSWKTLELHKTGEVERLREKTGLLWKDNALRHSYGSYRLALTNDIGATALEMGTSAKMIRLHYHDPKEEADARAWFEISPPGAFDNVLSLPLDFTGAKGS